LWETYPYFKNLKRTKIFLRIPGNLLKEPEQLPIESTNLLKRALIPQQYLRFSFKIVFWSKLLLKKFPPSSSNAKGSLYAKYKNSSIT
jgi:hypothetical protein